MEVKKKLIKICYHTFVIMFGAIMIYPVLWMISGSFKDNGEILKVHKNQ
jgi:multiple sugar transport system permease protein